MNRKFFAFLIALSVFGVQLSSAQYHEFLIQHPERDFQIERRMSRTAPKFRGEPIR